MPRAVLAFLAGCVLTLAAVALSQSWLPTLLDHTWLKDHQDQITAVVALGGLVVAALGVVSAVSLLYLNARAVTLAAETARWGSTRDILWRFNDQWAKLYDTRVKAGEILDRLAALEATTPQADYKYERDLSEVLNHFDSMAFMGRRKHLDTEMAWSYYFEDAARLWNRSIGYIRWRRTSRNDWTLFAEYEDWIHDLAKMDSQKRKQAKPHKMLPVEIAETRAPKT